MTKLNRIWAAVITFCMLFALIPSTVIAEDALSGSCGSNVNWEYNETSKTLTISGTGAMSHYSQTTMLAPWVANENIKTNLEKVIINDGVTWIGNYAFWSCEALKEVRLAESVNSLGMSSFNGCKNLTQINTDKVTAIWSYAFSGCESLESVTLAEGLSSVWSGTFTDCKSLTSLHIPKSVTSFEDRLYGCSSLESITVDDANRIYSSADGVLYNKDKTTLIKFPQNKSIAGFNIPDTVTVIAKDAFSEHQNISEYDENGLLISGKWIVDAKYDLGENYVINVDGSVTHIADGVFSRNYNLKSITIPKNIISLHRSSFTGDDLESISVDADNPAYSSLDGVLYDKNKINLISYPFSKTDTEFTAPSTLKNIGESSFNSNKKLRTVNLPNVEVIGDSAFESTNVTTVNLSPSLKKIDNWAFNYCGQLKKADLPNGLEHIGMYAFRYCNLLENIRIPESVTYIGVWAFDETYILDTSHSNDTVFYHDNWLLYAKNTVSGRFEVQDGTVGLAEEALYNCSSITSVKLPSSIKYINARVFDSDRSLTDIYYDGSESDWQNIAIDDDNYRLSQVTIHYEGTSSPSPSPSVSPAPSDEPSPSPSVSPAPSDEPSPSPSVSPAPSDEPSPSPSVSPAPSDEPSPSPSVSPAPSDEPSPSPSVSPAPSDEPSPSPTSTPSSGGGGSVTRYTVTFDTNGGSTIAKKSVYRNSTISEPVAPIKDGYVFGGWYTDSNCTKEYDFKQKITKSFTLYAKWTEKPQQTDKPSDWENPFKDVFEKDWFYLSVKNAVTGGIMNGISSSEFGPNEKVTRAMFVTLMYRIEKEPPAGEVKFNDVISGAWYAKAVAWAYEQGIVAGVSDTEFQPDALITREQATLILYRYAKFKGYDTNIAKEEKYTDSADISDYARDAVNWAADKGIMSGYENVFAPKDNITRAQAAAVFTKLSD